MKDIDKVKKMLQTSAKLQFWEVQQFLNCTLFPDISNYGCCKRRFYGSCKKCKLHEYLQLDKLRAKVV
jgi:SecD/SecF fusion protein